MDDARPCARRDSTAGPLNDRGARAGAHLPILDRPGDLMGREWGSLPCWMDRCSGHYRDPSVSLLSPVIENHVKGQLCGTACPSLNAAPFSQNMTTTTLTG